jgi:hypothetical protein
MGTYGLPADMYAQQLVHIELRPSPPVSVSPEPSASPPASPPAEGMAWEAPVVTVLPISATS